jgi:hypothetical protein
VNPTSRALSLMLLLLERRSTINWYGIVDELSETYGGIKDCAARKKFERDKSILAQSGIDVVHCSDQTFEQLGYFLDKEALPIPNIRPFLEEQVVLNRMLQQATSYSDFPLKRELICDSAKFGINHNVDSLLDIQSTPAEPKGKQLEKQNESQKLIQVIDAIIHGDSILLTKTKEDSGECKLSFTPTTIVLNTNNIFVRGYLYSDEIFLDVNLANIKSINTIQAQSECQS